MPNSTKSLDYIKSVIKMVEDGDIRYIISIDYENSTDIARVKYIDNGGNFHAIKHRHDGFVIWED